MNIWIMKTVFPKKRLICKLLLECEDEVLSTTETLPKKVACEKSNCPSCTILCFSCYFYCTKYLPKKKHLLQFQDTRIR